MRLDNNVFESVPELPPGFSYKFFSVSDVCHWARIETSVLEFDTVEKAEEFFKAAFLPYKDDLPERCLFVLNPEGLPIATANAWYTDSKKGRRALVHWVSVCPEYQGLGIGKALTKKVLSVLYSLDKDKPVWLHTQTWSHTAIRLYHSLGFNMVQKERLIELNTANGKPLLYKNEYNDAIEVLKAVYSESYIEQLIRSSVQ